jgi:hypothetical protein
MHPLLTALLALPAALAGVTLSLLLALGVAWSGACALCWELWRRCTSRRPPHAGSHSSWQVAEAVSMHGMQLQQAPGVCPGPRARGSSPERECRNNRCRMAGWSPQQLAAAAA